MGRLWCDDPYEERRQARDDYSRRGPYGYDRDRYRNTWDACDEEYTREFDRLRREEDDQRRADEEAQERAHARAMREQADFEAAEVGRYEQQPYPEQDYPPEPYPDEPEPSR